MTNDENKRFASKLGNEYDLIRMAVPYHDLLQQTAASEVHRHFSTAIDYFSVLEIGFGTGLTSEALLKDGRAQLVGVDNERHMLDKALDRLRSHYKNRFTLHIDGALKHLNTCGDETFDAVASVWTLHNINKDVRSEIYKEIFRVLKKGGIFVNGDKVATPDPHEHRSNLSWQTEMFEVFANNGRQDLKDEWVQHYEEDEKPDRVMVEDATLAELSAAGFKNARVSARWHMDAVIVGEKQA